MSKKYLKDLRFYKQIDFCVFIMQNLYYCTAFKILNSSAHAILKNLLLPKSEDERACFCPHTYMNI